MSDERHQNSPDQVALSGIGTSFPVFYPQIQQTRSSKFYFDINYIAHFEKSINFFLTWLSEKFQLNSIVCYFTTKNTKITKARKNNRPFALRALRGNK